MTYSISHATEADLPVLLGMAKEFIEYLNNPYSEWHEESMIYRLLDIMKHFFILVKKDGEIVGALGAYISPNMWDIRKLQIEECFWWVNKDARQTRAGALLLSYFLAESEKAKLKPILHLLSHSDVRPETLKKRGLVPTESTYYME